MNEIASPASPGGTRRASTEPTRRGAMSVQHVAKNEMIWLSVKLEMT